MIALWQLLFIKAAYKVFSESRSRFSNWLERFSRWGQGQQETEPEFLNILKWWLGWKCEISPRIFSILNANVESFNFILRFSELITPNSLYNQRKKLVTTVSPAVHSYLWKDGSPRKVDFSASTMCLRIRAPVSWFSTMLYTCTPLAGHPSRGYRYLVAVRYKFGRIG
jgi:hypothetical protein